MPQESIQELIREGKVIFWDSYVHDGGDNNSTYKLLSPEEEESEFEQILAVINKGKSGLNLERLGHDYQDSALSIRDGDTNRYIFTVIQYRNERRVFFLAYTPHKYEKVGNKVKALIRHLNQIKKGNIPEDELTTLIENSQQPELPQEIIDSATAKKNSKKIKRGSLFSNQRIEHFEDDQSGALENILKTFEAREKYTLNNNNDDEENSLAPSSHHPILGVAGSGKTEIAFASLIQLMRRAQEANQPFNAVFVAKNIYLARKMQNAFAERLKIEFPNGVPENIHVHFKIMDQVLEEKGIVKKSEGERLEQFLDFQNWCKFKGLNPPPNNLYDEFRLLYAVTKEEYLNEKKQSRYHYPNEKSKLTREQIWECFTAFNARRPEQKVISFAELRDRKISDDQKFDYMVVDEAQNFNFCELNVLKNMVRNEQWVPFGDPRQGSVFSGEIIEKCADNSGKTQAYILKTSLRCPKKGADLHNYIASKETQHVTGELGKRDFKIQSLLEAEEGNMVFYEDKDTNSLAIKEFIAKLEPYQFAILVANQDKKSEAEKRYGIANIFTVEESRGLEFEYVIAHRAFGRGDLLKKSDNTKEKIKSGKVNNPTLAQQRMVDMDDFSHWTVITTRFLNGLFVVEQGIDNNSHHLYKGYLVEHPELKKPFKTSETTELSAEEKRRANIEHALTLLGHHVDLFIQAKIAFQSAFAEVNDEKKMSDFLELVKKHLATILGNRDLFLSSETLADFETKLEKILKAAGPKTAPVVVSSTATPTPNTTVPAASKASGKSGKKEASASTSSKAEQPSVESQKVNSDRDALAKQITDYCTGTEAEKKEAVSKLIGLATSRNMRVVELIDAIKLLHLKSYLFRDAKDLAGIILQLNPNLGLKQTMQKRTLSWNNQWKLSGAPELFERLLNKEFEGNIKGVDDEGRSFLHRAAADGNTRLVTFLIDKGWDVDQKDKGGRTPICHAIELNKHDVVNLLIARGANINAKNSNGLSPIFLNKTPLCMAAQLGNAADVMKLLEGGAKPEVEDACVAAALGHLEVVRALIETGGLNVNAKNHFGSSILSAAVAGERIEVVDYLFSKGAEEVAREQLKQRSSQFEESYRKSLSSRIITTILYPPSSSSSNAATHGTASQYQRITGGGALLPKQRAGKNSIM